jgi:ketosteroid isomerase-like protein
MSSENVEIVRRWAWAFNDDTDAFCELTHPQIEWAPFEENHTPSFGLDRALAIRDGWLSAWDEHDIDVAEMLDAGDDVVASVTLSGRGKGSGAGVDVHMYPHFKIRDGKVVYIFEYLQRADAVAAAGLEE